METASAGANILFVTGTDTGIGKTAVSTLLCASLKGKGFRVKVVKPVESGCAVSREGGLIASDGELLRAASGSLQPVEEVVPYRFRSPVAPIVASEAEGCPIGKKDLLDRIRKCTRDSDLLLVEGAGGLLVPLSKDYTFADLASDLEAAVLVVVGSRLGAINHALLTFEVIRRRKLKAVGYVFNDLFNMEIKEQDPSDMSPADALGTNRELLCRMAKCYELREVGFFPRIENIDNLAVISRYAASVDAHKFSDAIIEYFTLSG